MLRQIATLHSRTKITWKCEDKSIMKISDFFLEHIPHSNMRCCKNPILQYKNSKIISFFGLDMIESYIYCRYWHSVHTKEEMEDKHFYCLICKRPEYFKEIFSFFFVNRIHALNPITYLMKVHKWVIHFWHIYFVWIKDLHSCPVCFKRYLNKTTNKGEKERRYSDMMKPTDPNDSDLW